MKSIHRNVNGATVVGIEPTSHKGNGVKVRSGYQFRHTAVKSISASRKESFPRDTIHTLGKAWRGIEPLRRPIHAPYLGENYPNHRVHDWESGLWDLNPYLTAYKAVHLTNCCKSRSCLMQTARFHTKQVLQWSILCL